jgi:hypothetical protein
MQRAPKRYTTVLDKHGIRRTCSLDPDNPLTPTSTICHNSQRLLLQPLQISVKNDDALLLLHPLHARGPPPGSYARSARHAHFPLCDQQRMPEKGSSPAQSSDQARGAPPCRLPDNVSVSLLLQYQKSTRSRANQSHLRSMDVKKSPFQGTNTNVSTGNIQYPGMSNQYTSTTTTGGFYQTLTGVRWESHY